MKKISYIILAFCFVLAGCENALVKTLDLDDFDYEKQLAISGSLISQDDEFKLLISENQAITDPFDEWVPAKDATARLFKDQTLIGNPTFTENTPLQTPNNIFTLNLESIDIDPGTYTLEVDHPTLGSASASTVIPADIQLDKIEYFEEYGLAPNFLTKSDAVLVTFNDPPEDNYYSLKIDLDTVIMDTFIYNLDTIVFENEPFLGVDSDELNAQMLQDGILFTDEFFNGQEHTVTLFLAGLEFNEFPEDILDGLRITWDVISRDKYEFDSSLELYYNSQGLGPFTEAVTIFNNVEGGLGIFSGLNRSFYSIPQ